MLSDFLQPIGEALFELAFYYIGRILIPVISLGVWHCEPLLSSVPKQQVRWGGMFHYRGSRIYFTSGGTAVMGAMFSLIVVAGVVGCWYLNNR